MIRHSCSIVDKLARFDLSFSDVFRPLHELKNVYVHKYSERQLDLHNEWAELSAVFDQIKQRAQAIDPTLGPSTEAVRVRLKKAITRLEKKLLKAEKRNHSDALAQLERIKEKLFPGGQLQERHENFGLLYVQHGPALIEELLRRFRPLEFKFTLLY